MANLVPMLGAVFAHATTPANQGRKQRPKPKTPKGRGDNKVTRGEKSVSQPHQQHGELASAAEPAPLNDRQQMKEHARHEKRRATEDWISGRITTHEHKAVHDRAEHVMSGKNPKHYSGKSGERKIKGLR